MVANELLIRYEDPSLAHPDVNLIIKVDRGDWPEVSLECCVSV